MCAIRRLLRGPTPHVVGPSLITPDPRAVFELPQRHFRPRIDTRPDIADRRADPNAVPRLLQPQPHRQPHQLRIGRIHSRLGVRKFEAATRFVDRSSCCTCATKRITRIKREIPRMYANTSFVGTPKHVELATNRIYRPRRPIDNRRWVEDRHLGRNNCVVPAFPSCTTRTTRPPRPKCSIARNNDNRFGRSIRDATDRFATDGRCIDQHHHAGNHNRYHRPQRCSRTIHRDPRVRRPRTVPIETTMF